MNILHHFDSFFNDASIIILFVYLKNKTNLKFI